MKLLTFKCYDNLQTVYKTMIHCQENHFVCYIPYLDMIYYNFLSCFKEQWLLMNNKNVNELELPKT